VGAARKRTCYVGPVARQRILGVTAIEAALASGDPVQVLLIGRDDSDPALLALAEKAKSAGVVIWSGSPGDLARMSPSHVPERAIAMVGPSPHASLSELFARRGALWLLHDAAYPSNVGFAVRTAEVSGADGVIVDARFNHDARGRVSHVSMGADRLLPVLYEPTEQALQLAAQHDYRIVGLEAEAERARPIHEVDLRGAVLLIAGNERGGLASDVIARCHTVASLPMQGFVPSYNVHAAIAAVAVERLRQLAG
jgi:23S rRNA (guanosine2251-2'-O)-methyltransferase